MHAHALKDEQHEYKRPQSCLPFIRKSQLGFAYRTVSYWQIESVKVGAIPLAKEEILPFPFQAA